LDVTIHHLQAIYSRPGTSAAARPKSSSSDEAMSAEESDNKEAVESGNEEAASPPSSMDLDNTNSSEEDAP
jgi:hypothetical protein